MRPFVVGKILRTLGTLLIVLTLTFVGLRATGDLALSMLPPDAPAEQIEAYTARWGLDRPLWEQYGRYLGNVLQGDFGRSFRDGRAATEVIGERVPATLRLMAAATLIMLLLGLPLGVVAALRHRTRLDRMIMSAAVVGYAMPNFFLGLLLILVFAVGLGVLPTAGDETWAHLVLPAITLAVSWAGVIARFTRSAMLDALSEPYVTAAAARGLPRGYVVRRHAAPNAAIPVVTVIGLLLGGMIGGAVVTEAVFAWPGLGRLLVLSVTARDLPVVQALVLLIATTTVLANLTVDLLYHWLDPRIGSGHGA